MIGKEYNLDFAEMNYHDNIVRLIAETDNLTDRCGMYEFIPGEERIRNIIDMYLNLYTFSRDYGYAMQICDELLETAEHIDDEDLIKEVNDLREDFTEVMKG